MRSTTTLLPRLAAVLLVSASVLRLGAQDAVPRPPSLSPVQVVTLVAEKTNVVLLDVRAPKEFAAGHLPRSTNLDSHAVDFRTQVARLDRSKTYVVHCTRSLRRTTDAVSVMDQLGFTNLVILEGGYDAWVKDNKPVEK